MTRQSTPDRINPDGSRTIKTKRACNGCGQLLGDITDHEMALAIAGAPLPDVRRECLACAPTAPEPACRPAKVLAGDQLCLEAECDHDLVDKHCDQVRQEIVCDTHSTFVAGGFDYEELVHAEPWPCKHSTPLQEAS